MDYHPKKSLDIWLNDKGFYRKHVAMDETCFFRAVSDQVYNTQIYHEDLRKNCVEFARKNRKLFKFLFSNKEWNTYLNKLEKHYVVCGNIEIEIISKMLEREFIIINSETFDIQQVTNNGYAKNIKLCKMKDNHYDSVCFKKYIENSGFCQSLVYKLLYKNVFGFEKVDEVVQEMLYSEDDEILNSLPLYSKDNDPPFPYKVAKALDPNQYRNIEFDAWNQTRKELRMKDWYMGGKDFKVGTKCLLMDNEQSWECYIQDLNYLGKEDDCLVYIVKQAHKAIVKRQNLVPEPNAKPWPLPFSISRNMSNETSTSTENVSSEGEVVQETTESKTTNKKRNKRRVVNKTNSNEDDNNNNDVACLEGCPLIASPENPYFDENFNISNNNKEEKTNDLSDNFISCEENVFPSNLNFFPNENYYEDFNQNTAETMDNYQINHPNFAPIPYSPPYIAQDSGNFVPSLQYDSIIEEQNIHTKVTTVCSQVVEKTYSNYKGPMDSVQVAQPTYSESQLINYPEIIITPYGPQMQINNPYEQPPIAVLPPSQYSDFRTDILPGPVVSMTPVPVSNMPMGMPMYQSPVPGIPCCVPNCPAIVPMVPVVLVPPTQNTYFSPQEPGYKLDIMDQSFSQLAQNKSTVFSHCDP